MVDCGGVLDDEEDGGESEGGHQEPGEEGEAATPTAPLGHANKLPFLWLTPSVARTAWPRSMAYWRHQTETQAPPPAVTPAGSGSSTVCPVYGPGGQGG